MLPPEKRGESASLVDMDHLTDSLLQDNHAHGMQFDKDRVPAFAMCEIAFLVSLTSVSSDVSQLAAQGLRLIAQAERQPGAPVNHGLTEEERSKRNPIYEQLGDPSVIIVGACHSLSIGSRCNFCCRTRQRAETCQKALAFGREFVAH